jgi:hypothetical protein
LDNDSTYLTHNSTAVCIQFLRSFTNKKNENEGGECKKCQCTPPKISTTWQHKGKKGKQKGKKIGPSPANPNGKAHHILQLSYPFGKAPWYSLATKT